MKRFLTYLYIAFLSLASLCGCSKKEEFEGERVDARLAGLLASYEAQLTGATNGWIGYLYPAGGGGYTFKLDFDANNRVTMYSTVKEAYATTAKESSYRLRATQVLSLYFDTYSYIHELADPDPTVAGGSTGEGHLSDFEFAILAVSPDTLRLKGNLNGSELVLVRATAGQGEGYMARVYARKQELEKVAGFPYYYNRLTVGGQSYNVTVNADQATLSIYGGAEAPTRNITYAATEDGLVLQEPFEDGDLRIGALHDVQVDEAGHTLSARLPDGTAIGTSNEASPVQVDAGAPARMYGESYVFYAESGVRINGVPDGLNLASVPGFVGFTYQPRRYVDGYDAFFLYWNNGQRYVGPALNTRVEPDGRLVFHNVAGFQENGTDGLTQENVDTINRWAALLIVPDGYYAYQTADKAYDLVSVSDARIWMRFE